MTVEAQMRNKLIITLAMAIFGISGALAGVKITLSANDLLHLQVPILYIVLGVTGLIVVIVPYLLLKPILVRFRNGIKILSRDMFVACILFFLFGIGDLIVILTLSSIVFCSVLVKIFNWGSCSAVSPPTVFLHGGKAF